MSDVLVNPEDEAPNSATTVEAELTALESRRAALLARKSVLDAAVAGATRFHRRLAIRLHARFCLARHPDGCGWSDNANPNHPDLADWTDAQHQRWLRMTLVIEEEINALRDP